MVDRSVFFPDVSHYQAGLDLSGAVACLAKATQGTSYIDPTYAGFKAQAAALGIPFGAYHWLDTTDPAAQARHAFTVVGPAVPLMIDDEQNHIDVAHTLAFVHAYRAAGGRVVLEYAPQWVWSASGKPSLAPIAAAGLFIVSSSYPTAGYTATGPGWGSYGGITPAIWQYTNKQQLNGRACDFNAYRGTADELRTMLHGRKGPDTVTTLWLIPGPEGNYWWDGTGYRRVRNLADEAYMYLGLWHGHGPENPDGPLKVDVRAGSINLYTAPYVTPLTTLDLTHVAALGVDYDAMGPGTPGLPGQPGQPGQPGPPGQPGEPGIQSGDAVTIAGTLTAEPE